MLENFRATGWRGIVTSLALLVVAIVWIGNYSSHLGDRWLLNRSAVAAMHGINGNFVQLDRAHRFLSDEDMWHSCHVLWLRLRVEYALGEDNVGLSPKVLACGPFYVPLLRSVIPKDERLATTALELQPDDAESWFWLAEIKAGFVNGMPSAVNDANRDAITFLFRKGLSLNPRDGLRWRELGDVLRAHDPEAAIEAYQNSCYNGDPGSNGCYRAGVTAEQLGEWERAASYFRRSRHAEIRQRADELEKRMRLRESH